ncbi:MAG TPA: EF-hand domain-containing protein [Amycolatopsis sp.]|jgi:Ca2+-binding EF-hand superfamily protein|nr:EF-hand domain-containing protein [Amycolatopsis sp.]
MPTEHQRQKYEKAFDRFDADGDGQLAQTDILALSQIWCDTFGVEPRSAEWQRINSLASTLWREILAVTDTDADGTVSKAEWNAAVERPDFVDRVAVPFALSVFDIADRDGTGSVGLDAMIAAQSKAGIDEAETRRVFSALDTDNDGAVTRDEFAGAIRDFYLSDDPTAAGSLLVGSL